jgi:hypothetical protein
LDAWSFADALRLDGVHWKPLCRQDPLLDPLRLLCRDEMALIEERTALVNQPIAALHEYCASPRYFVGTGLVQGHLISWALARGTGRNLARGRLGVLTA